MSNTSIAWVAADWGSTHLRLWAMSADNQVLAQRHADSGIASLTQQDYETTLRTCLGDWLQNAPLTVLAAGMVGARQGWQEAPYRHLPCAPLDPQALTPVACRDPYLHMHIVSGLCQKNPADVMRGEETQIAGLLDTDVNFSGVACLPGTHSKWARLQQGQVQHFSSFMTGELFSLLCQHSLLRSTLDKGNDWREDDFQQAVLQSQTSPEALTLHIFSLRAESLLHGLAPERARARLSGYLIGSELATARRLYGDQPLVLLASDPLRQHYSSALNCLGLRHDTHEAETMLLRGLCRARTQQLAQ